jgi:hypothetical protein
MRAFGADYGTTRLFADSGRFSNERNGLLANELAFARGCATVRPYMREPECFREKRVNERLERSMYSFVLRYSGRQQPYILAFVVLSWPVGFMLLDLPKQIINRAQMASRFARVAVLVDGQLVEDGSYDELNKEGTALHELLQSS